MTNPKQDDELLAAALAVRAGGVSIIPTSAADKRPVTSLLPGGSWRPFQERIVDEPTVRLWAKDGRLKSFGVVCGKVSGGLLVIDFDEPRLYDAWLERVGELAMGLPVQRTGREGGGYQVHLRCPTPGGNQKLAWVPEETEPAGRKAAVETRGEGGYAVLAPSLHPSGRRYELIGGTFSEIPTVSQAVADALLAAARTLDEAPLTRQQWEAGRQRESTATQCTRGKALVNGLGNVIDLFNRQNDIEAMLESCGYFRSVRGMYARPGKDSRFPSVTVKDGRSFHHSTNDVMNDGYWHSPFDLYAQYEHGGDCKAAVKASAKVMGIAHPERQSSNGRADNIGLTPREWMVSSARRPATPAIQPPVAEFEPFPVASLPPVVARFVEEGADAIGCDTSFIALPTIVMLGAAIGTARRVQLKQGWNEPPTCWGAVVAESGTMKTGAQELALRPLQRQQEKLFAEHEKAMAAYTEAKKTWKALPKEERDEEPEPPTACERLIVGDATVEAIADRLTAAPRGLLSARDELTGWFGAFNAYKQGKGSDVGNWLGMHGARSLTIDRKTGDRKTIYVRNAAVSVIGTIQPGALKRSLTDEFYENGLAARLLFAFPPKTKKRWTDATVDGALQGRMDGLVQNLLKLKHQPGADGPEPVDLPLDSQARPLWIDFVNDVGQEQFTRQDERVTSAWSKLEGYAARFALIDHLARVAAGDVDVNPRWIGSVSVQSGIALARWFGREAERVYVVTAETDEDRERRRLTAWIRDRGGAATPRDLSRSSPRRYPTTERAWFALQRVVEAGVGHWIHPPASGGRGRPPDPYFELGVADEPSAPR